MGIYSNNIHRTLTDQYIKYIIEHQENVIEAFNRYGELLCQKLGIPVSSLEQNCKNHDKSKFSTYEFEGYRQYFYHVSGEKRDEELFKKSWLHHQNNNMHHPEYWVLRTETGIAETLDMPDLYIAEMLIDWAAMSMKFNDTVEKYYNKKGYSHPFSEKTRNKVESLLSIFNN